MANIEDIIEENLTKVDDKNLTYGNGELSISFEEGQSDHISVNDGDVFVVKTAVYNPRDANERIIVIPMREDKIDVISTTKDENLSDENIAIFKTVLMAISPGIERVSFKVIDSNLSSEILNLTIDSVICGVSEAEYDVLKSGESNSKIVLGTKLGFNSVEIIYPKLETDSEIEFQDFTYIADNGDGSTTHSSSSINAFSFIKFIEDLERRDYKIKYRKDDNLTLICLDGEFPDRAIITETKTENIEEEEAPINLNDLL